MGRMRKAEVPVTTAETEVIVPAHGRPMLVGEAPKFKSINAAFLAGFQKHFEAEGHGIFAKMYLTYPQLYWAGLISLAKVLKIEIGGVDAFSKPSSRDEALDRVEARGGKKARLYFERMLGKIEKFEAELAEEEAGDNVETS